MAYNQFVVIQEGGSTGELYIHSLVRKVHTTVNKLTNTLPALIRQSDYALS